MARYRRSRRSRRSSSRGSVGTGAIIGLAATVLGMAVGGVLNTKVDKNTHAAISAGALIMPIPIPFKSRIALGLAISNPYVWEIGTKVQNSLSGIGSGS